MRLLAVASFRHHIIKTRCSRLGNNAVLGQKVGQFLGSLGGLFRIVALHLGNAFVNSGFDIIGELLGIHLLRIEVRHAHFKAHDIGGIELGRQSGLTKQVLERGVDVHDERGGITLVHHGKAFVDVARESRRSQHHHIVGVGNNRRGVIDHAADIHFHQIANLRQFALVLSKELVVQTILVLFITRIRVVFSASTQGAHHHQGQSGHRNDTFFHFSKYL